MKRVLATALAILFLTGCKGEEIAPTEPVTEAVTENEIAKVHKLPFEGKMKLLFASGAGAWGSMMTLYSDGSFEIDYHDTDMGGSGKGFESTVYICNAKGKFKDFVKIDDYTYSMKLDFVETEKMVGEEWIGEFDDGAKVRFVASVPFGISDGEDFVFYLPGAPIKAIDEEFLSWSPSKNSDSLVLSRYAVRNVSENVGFFTQNY